MNWLSEHAASLLEWSAVLLGIAYVVLAAKNHIACWSFGIANAVISVVLFVVYADLYSEAILYSFYIIAGIYGWFNWNKQKAVDEVFVQKLSTHLLIIMGGIVVTLGLYYFITSLFVDAQKPMIDAFTTVFSFIATYMTTRKWIENWIYWIVIDALSTYLYFSRGLEVYGLLMLAYTFIAAYGYLQWRKLKVVRIGA